MTFLIMRWAFEERVSFHDIMIPSFFSSLHYSRIIFISVSCLASRIFSLCDVTHSSLRISRSLNLFIGSLVGVIITTPFIDLFNRLQLYYYILIYSPMEYPVLGNCPLVILSRRNARSYGKLEFQMHCNAPLTEF